MHRKPRALQWLRLPNLRGYRFLSNKMVIDNYYHRDMYFLVLVHPAFCTRQDQTRNLRSLNQFDAQVLSQDVD
jgi:hypothetical protein